MLPGFANAHSHAFHRALRGRTHDLGGTFWTWREHMYRVADRLDPDSYLALARAVYAEMALAGVTCVGEFHYLHHAPGGTPYDDPNAMAEASASGGCMTPACGSRCSTPATSPVASAAEGHTRPDAVQQRFSDGSSARWVERVSALKADDDFRIGSAIHSVRAVPRLELGDVAQAFPDRPLHAHLSEQFAENEAALAFYGRSPTELLAGADALGPSTTVVHATVAPHMGCSAARARRCACVPPPSATSLTASARHGSWPPTAARCVSGATRTPWSTCSRRRRALEMHERLFSLDVACSRRPSSSRRSRSTGTRRSAGRRPDASPSGPRADLVAVRLDTIRTAGTAVPQAIYGATASDVHAVVNAGRTVVSEGQHVLGDVGRLLSDAIAPLWEG